MVAMGYDQQIDTSTGVITSKLPDVSYIPDFPTDAETNLYKKKIRVMGDISTFRNDAKHDHFRFRYVSSAQVLEQIRQALTKHNLSFNPHMLGIDRTTADRWIVIFDMRFTCPDTGMIEHNYWFQDLFPKSEKNKTDDKAFGKAETYAVKYFLMKTFVAGSEDDPDLDKDSRGAGEAPTDQQAPEQIQIATGVRWLKRNNGKIVFEFTFGDESNNIDMLSDYFEKSFKDTPKEQIDAYLSALRDIEEKKWVTFKSLLLPQLKVRHEQKANSKYRMITGLKPLTVDENADPIAQTPQTPVWGEKSGLDAMYNHIIASHKDISRKDIATALEFPNNQILDPKAWAEKFETGKLAIEAFTAFLDQKAKPKSGNPLKDAMNNADQEDTQPETVVMEALDKIEYKQSGKRKLVIVSKGESGKKVTFYNRDFIRELGDLWAEFADGWEVGKTYDLTEQGFPKLSMHFEGKPSAKNLIHIETDQVFDF